MVGLSTMVFGALLALNFNPNQADPFEYGSSRITATAAALITGEDTPQRAGLANLNFRLSVYDGAISELGSSSMGELLLGHGTSSGGNVVMRVFPRSYKADTLDPNRVLHNEWLRALYEWGVGGLCLVIAVLATLLIGLVRRYNLDAARVGSAIALSFCTRLLVGILNRESDCGGWECRYDEPGSARVLKLGAPASPAISRLGPPNLCALLCSLILFRLIGDACTKRLVGDAPTFRFFYPLLPNSIGSGLRSGVRFRCGFRRVLPFVPPGSIRFSSRSR